MSSQSLLSAWYVAGALLRYTAGCVAISFRDRTHAISVSLLARASLRGPQKDSTSKPRRLCGADGDSWLLRACLEYRGYLDERSSGTGSPSAKAGAHSNASDVGK